jgi:hypothetical protein
MSALQPQYDQSEPERWCAGLPFAGTRPMRPIEREAATAVARKQLTAMGVTLAILLAVASLPLAIPNGYRVPDIGPWAAVILSVVAVFGYFGSIAVLILRARDLWRTRARFLADIAAGTVMEFAGPVPAAAPADEDQRALIKLGMLVPGGSASQRIAVLAVTHSIMYRDSRGGWQARKARVRAVAPTLLPAVRGPVARDSAFALEPSKELVRRSLEPAEREEIRHYIRQVWRPQIVVIIGLFMIHAVWLLNSLRANQTMLGRVTPLLLLAFAARFVPRLVTDLRRATLLARDIKTGWVFIAPREVDGVGRRRAAVEEFLPVSGAIWTEGGRPASWRNLES